MKKSRNNVLTVIMIILIVLLVAAVVLLSLIIVSIVGDKKAPVTSVTEYERTVSSKDNTVTKPQVTTVFTDPFGDLTVPNTIGPDPVTSKNPDVSGDPSITVNPPDTDPAVTVNPPDTDPAVTVTEPPVITTGPAVEDDPDVKTQTLEDGTVVKSGTFEEENGTQLHLTVEWEAVYPADSDNVILSVKVYLHSYSLDVGSRENGVISINGQETSFSTKEMHLDNTSHKILLASRSMTIDKPSGTDLSLDILAKWHFGGTYSGKSLPDLAAEKTIKV